MTVSFACECRRHAIPESHNFRDSKTQCLPLTGPRSPCRESLKRMGSPKGRSWSPRAHPHNDHTLTGILTLTHTHPPTRTHTLTDVHNRTCTLTLRHTVFTHTDLTRSHIHTDTHSHTHAHRCRTCIWRPIEVCEAAGNVPPRIFQPASQSPWNPLSAPSSA